MIAILDKATFFIFILTILVLVGRGIWQIKKVNLPNSFYPINYIGMLIFIFGLIFQNFSIWGLKPLLVSQSGLGLSIFSLFAICSMSLIDNISTKKVKTLLRVPIIGFLLAIYLVPTHFAIAICVIELIQLSLFFKYRQTQRYAYRQQCKAIFGMFLALFLYYNQLWLFNLGLTIYFVMKFQITNGVKLKLLIMQRKQEI